MTEKLYTILEVSEKVGVSRPLVHRWVKGGSGLKLKSSRGVKYNRVTTLIKESDLNEFLNKRKRGAVID